MKLVKLWVLVLGLGWGLVCWGEPGGGSDSDKASQPACCYGTWKGTIGSTDVDVDKAFQQGDFEQVVASLESQLPKLLCDNSPVNVTDMRVKLAEEYTDKLVQLASAYQSMGLVKVALDRLQCAESIAKQKLKKSLYHANVLNELSSIYQVMGDMEYKECQFAGGRRRAAREENLTKAISYADKAIEAMNMAVVRVKDDTNLKLVNANILNNYGNILTAQEKYKDAIQKYEDGAKFVDDGIDLSMETKILLNRAKAMVERKSKGDLYSYDENEYITAVENAKGKVEKLSSKQEKLFHLTGLVYIVQELLQKRTFSIKLPEWWSCPNDLLETNLYDGPHDDAVAFAKNYLARSYADMVTKSRSSTKEESRCGDLDPNNLATFREKSKRFIEQAIREVQSCSLLPPNYRINGPYISGFKVYLPSSEDRVSKEQCQEECKAVCNKDFLSPCEQDRTFPCKEPKNLRPLLEDCKGNCDEIPSLFPQDHGICEKVPSSFLQNYHPEWLFNLQWQLGRIYKAQGQLEEALCPYERATKYLQLVQRAYGYPNMSPRSRDDRKQFYLDRADLLLQVAKIRTDKGMKDDQQNLLKATMDSIESLQETSLQNYFQDECVTQKFPERKEKQLQENEILVYLVRFDNRVELMLKFSDGRIRQEIASCNFCEDNSKIKKLRSEAEESKQPVDLMTSQHNGDISSLIVKPLKNVLDNNTKIDTLIIVATDELLRIPFASLIYEDSKGEKSYLIQHYAIAVLPNWRLSNAHPLSIDLEQDSALLAGLTEPSPPAVVTSGGDGRGDPLCTKPLNYVQPEIEGLQGIIVKHRNPPLWKKDFTIEAVEGLLKEQKNDYPIIHLSTHGYFERLSGDSWLCTYNGVLTLDKLEEILQKQRVKLLTLSACQTALGAELGLAGMGVKVGTQSALGSLWPVDDKSTALLMQHFYENLKSENLKKNGNSIAKALQDAQLSLLGGKRVMKTEKGEIMVIDLHLPYYWAGFLLTGNWRNNLPTQ